MSLLVIGSANTDMVVKTDKMPIPGETVLGGEFSMNFGGKGANQAVCSVKLGMKTGFYTRLGNDVFGERSLKYYKDLGIDTSHIDLLNGIPSGVALITVDKTGENSIVVASGANSAVLPLELEYSRDYINTFNGVLVQFEIPIKTALVGIELAYTMQKKVIVNPAPVKFIPDRYFKMIDVLIPNENEAKQLLGLEPDCNDYSVEELGCKIREKGVKNLVITLGTKGSYVSGEEGNFFVNAYKVESVDTTGAGDAFCAAFTYCFLQGKTLKESADFASKVAAVKVTKMGAQNTPTLNEIENYLFN